MTLGISLPALPALRDTEIGQRCRIAGQDIIGEFGSTGLGNLLRASSSKLMSVKAAIDRRARVIAYQVQ
jgi:hypothetical protein